MRKPILAAVLALLAALPAARAAEPQAGPLIARDVEWSPIFLQSPKKIFTWTETDSARRTIRYFLCLDDLNVRQGPVRIHIPQALVWFYETESRFRRAATIRIYGEAQTHKGRLVTPISLVETDTTRRGSNLFLSLRSRAALRWNSATVPLENPPRHPLIDRARHVLREYNEGRMNAEFLSPEPLELPKGRWSFDVPVVTFDNQAIFQDPKDPDLLIVVLMGHVRLLYRDTVVEADRAVLWVNKTDFSALGPGAALEIYAEGYVRLRQKTGASAEPIPPGTAPGKAQEALGLSDKVEAVTADRLYINPRRFRAAFKNPEIRLRDRPNKTDLVARGKEAYQLDKNNSLVHDAEATDCPFTEPHYAVTASRIRLVRKGPSLVVSGWNLTARVAGVPVFWLPFLAGDVAQPSFLIAGFRVGSSSRFGVFEETDINLRDLGANPPWMKQFLLHADYYSRRGPGVGTTGRYVFGKHDDHLNAGRFHLYYVNDHASTDRNGIPVPDDNRWRAKLQHRWELIPAFRIDAEVSYLSDQGFLPEYYEQEFEEEKEQETLVFARWREGSLWAGALAKKRINDFQTQLEELPSIAVEVVRRPFLHGFFQYSSETLFGYYNLQTGRFTGATNPDALARVHTDHTLTAPIRLWALRINPFIRALGTLAQLGADPGPLGPADLFNLGGANQLPQTGSSLNRLAFGGGLDASLTLSRIYDVRLPFLGIDRLRHIVQPEVRVDALPAVTTPSAEFLQMDRVDAIDDSREFRAGLRQRIQTKRDGRTVDLLKLDAFFVNSRSHSAARGLPGLEYDYIDVDAAAQLTRHLAFVSYDNRISIGDGPDHWNGGLALDYSPRWQAFAGLRRVMGVSTSGTVDLAVRLSEKYTARIYEKYEFEGPDGDDNNLESRFSLERRFHKWVLQFTARHDEADRDTSFMVYLRHVAMDPARPRR
jgi:LPS-assembly protein